MFIDWTRIFMNRYRKQFHKSNKKAKQKAWCMKFCKRNILDLIFYLCWTFLAPCPDFPTNFDNLLRAQQFDNLKRKKKTDVIWSLTAAGKGCIHLVSHWISLSDTLMYPMILSSLVLCRMISIQFACALSHLQSDFSPNAFIIFLLSIIILILVIL